MAAGLDGPPAHHQEAGKQRDPGTAELRGWRLLVAPSAHLQSRRCYVAYNEVRAAAWAVGKSWS